MSRICFVTYEIHPTTWGGCGVLIHHLAEQLLRHGHEVVLLLDIPPHEFERFDTTDRHAFPNPQNFSGHRVDALCEDFPFAREDVPNLFLWKSMRFAHALAKVTRQERIDYVEFFEYCGAGYAALARKIYGMDFADSILGERLHTSVELMDRVEATKPVDAERYAMYGMEHAALHLAESILIPGQTFFRSYYETFYGVDARRAVLSPPPLQPLPPVYLKPPEQRRKIVFLGRIYQLKGVEQLVKAAILLLQRRMDRSLQFVLIGNDANDSPAGGSYTRYLEHLIPATLRRQFLFTGHLPHDRVAEHLSEALFCVFPNRFESFCYALHEAAHAGVPVIANDLPAFHDSFRHEQEALFYDGTTKGLMAAMERLLDDEALRSELGKARPLSGESSMAYYDAPVAAQPLRAQVSEPLEAIVAVLDGQEDDQALDATRRSLERQSSQSFSTVIFRAASGEENGAFVWLGQRWTAQDAKGEPVDVLSLETSGALLVLRAGDTLEEDWMRLCLQALASRPMGFSGTWMQGPDGPIAAMHDLAPEAYPFWHGEQLTRSLLRTERSSLLLDLFDPNLGPLGEVGYLWAAVEKFGRGVLLPEARVFVPQLDDDPAQSVHLGYLLARHGAHFHERLALLNATLANGLSAGVPAEASDALRQTLEQAQQNHLAYIQDLQSALEGGRITASCAERPRAETGLLRAVQENTHELSFIKARISYRLPRRLRKTPLYSALRWAKSNPDQLLTIRALGKGQPEARDTEVWLLSARFAQGEPSVPWDYMAASQAWQLVDRPEGPAGRALVGKRGSVRFMLHGDNPVLELLCHPWSGQVEITYGQRREIIDLYAPDASTLLVHPASSPMAAERIAPKPAAAVTAPAANFLPHEEDWLEQTRQAQPHAVALHVPRWMGVTASTRSLFQHTLAFPHSPRIEPYGLGEDEIQRCVRLLLESGIRHVVASGGDRAHFEVCRRLKESKPSMRCDLLWHGTYVQFSEDYNWQVLKLWIEAARSGLIHTLGTVKKGQERFFESLGCRGRFLMNFIERIPAHSAAPLEGGPHLGIWLSGDGYRKLPYAMLSAARMIGGAVVHGSHLSARAIETITFLGLKHGGLHTQALSRGELAAEMRRMHLNLYVTFAECAPMLPLESLAHGVPCLLGPTSHYFEDDEYLHSRLVVACPDRADAIAAAIEQSLSERESIINAYAAYAPAYNQRAQESVRAFLESD